VLPKFPGFLNCSYILSSESPPTIFISLSSFDYSTRYLAFIEGNYISLFFGLKVKSGTVQSPFSSSHFDL